MAVKTHFGLSLETLPGVIRPRCPVVAATLPAAGSADTGAAAVAAVTAAAQTAANSRLNTMSFPASGSEGMVGAPEDERE
ncbi:hypothetical protein [Saccharothrix obliqua]|uniref:hypothetical protein n=1 Tax=Saccharothrix obliqua TaxID=2861747 RepID=UPI001C5D9758|nr:hypothetical protein [Saccharothrix obliqua]MBW4721543.1 hypothetical protein [Saccharothrix obliqua]